MPRRHRDWLNQAKRDLRHARHALQDKEYEWSCFASQQSAEKAVKAVYQKIGADAWGYSVSILLANLSDELRPDEEIVDLAKELDKHCISPRYPNFHPEIQKIIVFGSLVRDDRVPGSDVDLLSILSKSDKPLLERITEYMPSQFPVGVDIFAYTRQELEAMIKEGNFLIKTALEQGRPLLE